MFTVAILNGQGEVSAYLTHNGKQTGGYANAHKFSTRQEADTAGYHFCQEHKGITFVAGIETEFDFGYEIWNENCEVV